MEEKKHKKSRLGLYISLSTLAVIVMIACVFLLHANSYVSKTLEKNKDRIFNDVYIENLNVSGMTKESAKKILTNHIDANLSSRNITLVGGDDKTTLKASEFGISYDADGAVDEAYDVGRQGNIITKFFLYKKMKDEPEPEKITLLRSVDTKAIEAAVSKVAKDFTHAPVNATLKITKKDKKKNIEIVKEKNGQKIITDKTVDGLETFFTKKWDLEDAEKKIYVEVDKPKYSSKDLEGITDVLGSYSTSYDYYYTSRRKNIELGASKINGTIMGPGEEFSVYKTAGPYSKDSGYLVAATYLGGNTVDDYGGGMCQVATTLYNAAIKSELDIKERHCHAMTVSYVPLSFDAAVSGKEQDLKFVNNGENLVFIHGETNDSGKITFTIYGKETRDPSRTIKFTSKTTSVSYPTTKSIKDKTLKKGKKVIDQYGKNGYTAEMWKTVYIDGKQQESKVFNKSDYAPMQQIERIGTKKEKKKNDKKKVIKQKKKKKT